MERRYLQTAVPALSVIIVALIFVVLHQRLDAHQGVLQDRLGVIWAATEFGLAAAVFWNFGTSTVIIHARLRDAPRKLRTAFILTLTAAAVGTMICVHFMDFAGSCATHLVQAIDSQFHANVSGLISLGNVVGAAAVWSILGAMTCLALPDGDECISRLAKAVRMWMLSLFGASVLLAFTVLEVWALYRWGATIGSRPEHCGVASLTDMADGIALAAGIVFTVLLLAIYVPVAVLHERWLHHAIEREVSANPSLDVDKRLAQLGLKTAPVSVGTALALPIVAFVFTTGIKATLGA